MKKQLLAIVSLSFVLAVGCESGRMPSEPGGVSLDAEIRQHLQRWGPIPIGEMAAQDPAQVELGRALFFDPILSGNRDIACATCHHPARALGDGLSLGIGTRSETSTGTRTLGAGRELLPRSAPSLLNSGLGAFYMFWDGRLAGMGGFQFTTPPSTDLPSGLPNALAAQAFFPVLDRREMRGHPGDLDVFGEPNELADFADHQRREIWNAVMRRLLGIPEYQAMFSAAYPTTPMNQIAYAHVARALAAFQMQAFTRTRSPFDRYLDRDDSALTIRQKRGALLFLARGQCVSCHSGPLLGAQDFANVGGPQIGPGGTRNPPLDLGRAEVENFDFYRFAFRIPPLRNVELTAPYMHSGAYPTLEAVVRHYNDVEKAMREYDVSQLHPDLRPLHHGDDATIGAVLSTLDFRVRRPLNLTEEEIGDLVAFLQSLTDPAARDLASIVPARVPSGLPVPE